MEENTLSDGNYSSNEIPNSEGYSKLLVQSIQEYNDIFEDMKKDLQQLEYYLRKSVVLDRTRRGYDIDYINYKSPGVNNSALSSYGFFSFGGLPDSYDNQLIAGEIVQSVGAFYSFNKIFWEDGYVDNSFFRESFDFRGSDFTKTALILAANGVLNIRSVRNIGSSLEELISQFGEVLSEFDTNQALSGIEFVRLVQSEISSPGRIPSYFSAGGSNSPTGNRVMFNNTTDIFNPSVSYPNILKSQIYDALQQVVNNNTRSKNGSNNAFLQPGISGTLFDVQLGKIPGASSNSPSDRALASVLTSVALLGGFKNNEVNNALSTLVTNPIAVTILNRNRAPTSQIGYKSQYPDVPYKPYGPKTTEWNPPSEALLSDQYQKGLYSQPGESYHPSAGSGPRPFQNFIATGGLIEAELRNGRKTLKSG